MSRLGRLDKEAVGHRFSCMRLNLEEVCGAVRSEEWISSIDPRRRSEASPESRFEPSAPGDRVARRE
jgi:hypothetical protein